MITKDNHPSLYSTAESHLGCYILKFPIFSKTVKYLKTTEGGLNSMCTVMQHYEEIAEQRGKRLLLFEMVQDGDIDVKKGALKTNLSEDEFLKEMKLAGFKPPIK